MIIDEGGMYPWFNIGEVRAFDQEIDIAYHRSFICFALPLFRKEWLYRTNNWGDAIIARFGWHWLRIIIMIQEYPDKPSKFEFRYFIDIHKDHQIIVPGSNK